MKEDIDKAIHKVFLKSNFILGEEVSSLEKEIAKYMGVKYAIGVASGTDALVIGLRAIVIKKRNQNYWSKQDLIITTPFTFTATAEAIVRAGATPVFVDIDPTTFNILPSAVEKFLKSSKGKSVVGIVPVHLYGLSCEMSEIIDIAKKYNLFVVEDVAQAFGAKYKEKMLGSFGEIGALSFFPTKNLGGAGDGGMILTNDQELAEIANQLRKHGGKDKYNVEYIGYNSRLDTIQAAILRVKMKYIEKFTSLRREIAQFYTTRLANLKEIILPCEPKYCYHVYNQYTIRVLNGKRDKLKEYLKNHNIHTMIYYPIPLYKMKVFYSNCINISNSKKVDRICTEVLSLPIEPLLTNEEQEYIVEKIRKLLK